MAAITFLSLKKQYGQLYRTAEIKPDWLTRLTAAANKIILNRAKYQKAEAATGVPWWFIGLIHMRESSFDFTKHLHNGDSLKAKTWRVPRGRPIGGTAPYDWYFSAADALKMKGLDKVVGWDIETVCYQLERYNGFGYRQYHPRTLSPYLWQGTDHYCDADSACGKYVEDSKFSATEADKQCGVIAVLKVLEEMGHVSFDVKKTVRETAKDSRTVRALVGVILTTIGGFFINIVEIIGRWLELLPGKIDDAELMINTAGKVATWLNIPLSVWVTGGIALGGVGIALYRAIQSERVVTPPAEEERA